VAVPAAAAGTTVPGAAVVDYDLLRGPTLTAVVCWSNRVPRAWRTGSISHRMRVKEAGVPGFRTGWLTIQC
jgi:hypothetical protein